MRRGRPGHSLGKLQHKIFWRVLSTNSLPDRTFGGDLELKPSGIREDDTFVFYSHNPSAISQQHQLLSRVPILTLSSENLLYRQEIWRVTFVPADSAAALESHDPSLILTYGLACMKFVSCSRFSRFLPQPQNTLVAGLIDHCKCSHVRVVGGEYEWSWWM